MKLTFNKRIIAVQCLFGLLLSGVLTFTFVQLSALSAQNKQDILRSQEESALLVQLDNMNLAVIREAKAAKDVWLRGADPEEKEKAETEFTDQIDNFQISYEEAQKTLRILMKDDPSLSSLLEKLEKVGAEQKKVGGKFLAQIKVHVSALDSDSKVKGVEKHLFRQIYELRTGLLKADEKNSADAIVALNHQYQLRSMILAAIALVSIALLATVSILLMRSVARQLGGDPAFVTEIANQISAGDLSAKIEPRAGDRSSLMAAMKTMIASVQALVSDAERLSQAAQAGHLTIRADANCHQGDFRKIIEGVNATLDAVVEPLHEAASCIDAISKGNVPGKITTLYRGDFSVLRDNLNACIDAVNALGVDVNMLSRAATEGRLDVRAEVDKHCGDFRGIVQGVNDTLDAIAAPVNDVAFLLSALAQGDLTESIQGEYQGAFERLAGDANTTVSQLTEIVSQIKQAADAVNTASQEIAAGNTSLSRRTEEQASNLEETAASMQQIAATVKQNSDNVIQANKLAAAASDVAALGGDVVNQVVGVMSSIGESSRKIADIISVIDGIAFQTNILALNAAVEAARAGEQGKGFAVVAGEVRNLAQRSAGAAKEIKLLIDDSVSKVARGNNLADKAGQTMGDVVSSVRRVTDIMAEISAAAIEQSSGISQVEQAIVRMDEVTQQNAALVEEAATSAKALESQAQQLNQLLGAFQLSDTSGTHLFGMQVLPSNQRLLTVLDDEEKQSTVPRVRMLPLSSGRDMAEA